MSTSLESVISEASDRICPSEKHLALTRKNGMEIVTVAGKTVTVTNLTGKVTSVELKTQIPFVPLAMTMSENEDVLCLYDEKNIAITYLQPIGSKITENLVTTVDFQGGNESIIQIVFNNVSKFQSEIVVLTNSSIKTYDINESSKTPVQNIPFTSTSDFNSSFHAEDVLIDPVSICFQPSGDPKGDLTLLILTADSSVYSIYPFFPHQLSVPENWISRYSLYNQVLVQTNASSEHYSKYVTGYKISTLLKENQDACFINEIIPQQYQRGKISGPIAIKPFPEELYNYEARKLVPLKDDFVSIVFDNCVCSLLYQSDGFMTFDGQTYSGENEDLKLIDAQIIDQVKYGKLIDAVPHPVTRDSILSISNLKTNYSVIQIDYSRWLPLSEQDVDEFSRLVESGEIPTTVLFLTGMLIPAAKMNFTEPSSKIAFEGTKVNDPSGPEFKLKDRHCNSLTFVWNPRAVYTVSLTASGHSLTLLSAQAGKSDLSPIANDNVVLSEDKKYNSKLSPSFNVFSMIDSNKDVLADLLKEFAQMKSSVVNIENAQVEDLKYIMEAGALTSKGQVSAFKTFAVFESRLRELSLEFHQQIMIAHKVKEQRKNLLAACTESKLKYQATLEREQKLQKLINKANTNLEDTYNKLRVGYLVISNEEKHHFKILEELENFISEKTKSEKEIRELLTKVSNADLRCIEQSTIDVVQDPGNKLKLSMMEKNLKDKAELIDYLEAMVKSITLE